MYLADQKYSASFLRGLQEGFGRLVRLVRGWRFVDARKRAD